LAFSTITGSGAAPDSFVGTNGVDSVTITNLDKAVDLTALDSDDIVNIANVNGVASAYSLRGGSGNDVITSGTVFDGVTIAAASFVNGNQGNDTLTFFSFLNVSSTSSTVVGGQGNDTINFTGSFDGSRVNGNMDADTIFLNGASNSSVYGGQGADAITAVEGNLTIVNTIIDGNDGNDDITILGNTTVTNSTINGGDGNDDIILGTAAGSNPPSPAVPLASFTNSSVFGGDGDDTLDATDAGVSVRLYGGDGDDELIGGAGGDRLDGGAGVDSLDGGADNDSFRYGALEAIATQTGITALTADTIIGFSGSSGVTPEGDTIVTDVAGTALNFGTGNVQQPASFEAAVTLANQAFIQNSALRYFFTDDGLNSLLFFEATPGGGTAADAVVQFNGTVALVAADITAA